MISKNEIEQIAAYALFNKDKENISAIEKEIKAAAYDGKRCVHISSKFLNPTSYDYLKVLGFELGESIYPKSFYVRWGSWQYIDE